MPSSHPSTVQPTETNQGEDGFSSSKKRFVGSYGWARKGEERGIGKVTSSSMLSEIRQYFFTAFQSITLRFCRSQAKPIHVGQVIDNESVGLRSL